MALLSIKTLFAFLFGLVLGSFLNVCIHRIPLKQSIVTPASSCPRCGKHIRFYDNIPILSYLFLLGKCRYCANPISIRYPLVELITGILSVALCIRYGPSLHDLISSVKYVSYLAFVASLILISFIDLQHKIIPDVISLPGILLGIILSIFPWYPVSWLDSLIGIVGGGGFLYAVAFLYERWTGREGMGGGDIKLLAMLGAWMGWKALPFVVFISSLTGILIGGGSLLLARRGYRARIPFGPFLALGALIYFFFGTEIIIWYYGLLR
jgi:leader peptidase (prepilin peptidase)/N-methyltransferase